MIEFGELSERLGLMASFTTDPNNNSECSSEKNSKRGEKYSLRPRSAKKRHAEDDSEEIISIPSKSSKSKTSRAKQKPAPLSKYRRKTANARERTRMKEINQAFETLRKVVPQMTISHQANEKLTKIMTLRLAMKYISTLSSVLSQEGDQQDLLPSASDFDSLWLESDGESLPLDSDFSDHSLTHTDFSIDFPDDSLTSVDFSSALSPDFSHHLRQFDPLLSGFS
ncbi:hypothetical protein WA026_009419 [Henosepilachna vigintioctopunctata]|uniref:BHLH domain-containing protein n=1 Tax=Henosepilachna vigintioctopunctata TaxID=420089 RepID=A0AAW1TZB5_9CUCU